MASRKLTVELEAQVARFQRGMQDANRSLSSMERSMQAARRAVVQFVGAYVGVRTLATGFRAMVQATTEAEVSSAKLEAVLKATGFAAGWTATRVDLLADSMARTTLRTDEEIRDLATVMATFRNIQGAAFEAAIRTTVDMATVMGTDLRSAAIQVGKALNDPILGVTALRRVGVQLTTQQQEQVKQFMAVNDIASAQKVILGELAQEFGGAGAAATAGLAGSINQARKAYDDFLESLGRTQGISGGIGRFVRSWTEFWRARELTTSEIEEARSILFDLEQDLEKFSKIRGKGPTVARIEQDIAATKIWIKSLEEAETQENRNTEAAAKTAREMERVAAAAAARQAGLFIPGMAPPSAAFLAAMAPTGMAAAAPGKAVTVPALPEFTMEQVALQQLQAGILGVTDAAAQGAKAIGGLTSEQGLATLSIFAQMDAEEKRRQAIDQTTAAINQAAVSAQIAAAQMVAAFGSAVAGIINLSRGGGGFFGALGGILSIGAGVAATLATGGVLAPAAGAWIAGGLAAGGAIAGSLASRAASGVQPVRVMDYDQRALNQLQRVQQGPSVVNVTIVDQWGNVLRTEQLLRGRSRRDAVERLPPGFSFGMAGAAP